jgi:hypothetical protein
MVRRFMYVHCYITRQMHRHRSMSALTSSHRRTPHPEVLHCYPDLHGKCLFTDILLESRGKQIANSSLSHTNLSLITLNSHRTLAAGPPSTP